MKTILSIRRLLAPAAALVLVLFQPSAGVAGNFTMAWGGNNDKQLDIPANAFSGADQIACGAYHSLALVKGRVYGWGATNEGALSFPDNLQDIVSIAAGDNSGIAINAYGGALFWGGRTNYNFYTYVPSGSFYVSAALGHDHGLLLTDAGSVEAWGAPESSVPVTTPNAEWKSGFTAVAAGRNFSMGLSNGIVHVAAPTNDPYKILEIPEAAKQFAPGTRHGTVTAIAAGPFHAMALTTNGEVLVWGAWVEDGEEVDPTAGISSRKLQPRGSFGNVTNVPPAALSGVKAIAAGYNMCAALTDAGQVLVWGNEASQGALDMADIPPYAQQDIQEIALGNQHVLVRSTWIPPEFTTDSLPGANLGSEYTNVVSVLSDPAATISVRDERSLPPGVSISPEGVFSGAPTKTGTNVFTLIASNPYGTATKSFTLVVSERISVIPEWITAELPPAVVGFPYSFQLEATESPTYSANALLPSWVSLSSSGLLTGTPTTNDVGSSYPTFTAANTAGPTNKMLELAVNPQSADTPPIIGLSTIPDLFVGTPASIDLQIVGASTVTLSGDLATSGFGVVPSNGRWMLTGTPTAAIQGTDRSAVIVAANSAAAATNAYTVTVWGEPVWRTGATLPTATVGNAYETFLLADWATSYDNDSASTLAAIPLSFAVATNESAQVVARLYGTPTNAALASTNISVTAKNAYKTAQRTFTLAISSTPAPSGEYRFLSIRPSPADSTLALTWTNLASPDTTATLVSTTNLLLDWPSNGTVYTSPATLPLPSVPTHYRLQAP
ncbi:MAG: hypothetical protein IK066_10690 [Kiritimatiellae bacterium]|nr:hypothetical protein [Kiritimatiellia bacterium]